MKDNLWANNRSFIYLTLTILIVLGIFCGFMTKLEREAATIPEVEEWVCTTSWVYLTDSMPNAIISTTSQIYPIHVDLKNVLLVIPNDTTLMILSNDSSDTNTIMLK